VRRGKIEIMAAILDICIGGANKTKVVYQANLNFRTVNPYLELLTRNGLIEIQEGTPTLYKTSSKGIEFMKNIDSAQQLLGEKVSSKSLAMEKT
jgi:predicted transcriptional regulator